MKLEWSPVRDERAFSILPDGRLGIGQVDEYGVMVPEEQLLSLQHGGNIALAANEYFEPMELAENDIVGAVVRHYKTRTGEPEVTEAYGRVHVQRPGRIARLGNWLIGRSAQAGVSVTYFKDTAHYRQTPYDRVVKM